ncbi:PREDICTED: C-type lectin 37Da-like [Nicrophorus vespilloides]|uniref:C-type lectin 37Da-like n=1 Tax=Nicrophorus vespilloides TaxID=110193 RepID=A0ABM1NAV7_NICVS|nr:PREDICTED: C-type lectin 37Da-like [Nicrophorus vespilloides]
MSRICVLFVLFAVCATAFSQPGIRNKRQSNDFRNKSYYVESLIKTNFFNAFMFCQRMNMRLLSIATNEEYDHILNILRTQIQFGPDSRLWTSGNDLAQEGKFDWLSSGHPVLINKWLHKQPDNRDGVENCVDFWNENGVIGLNDDHCGVLAYFICEKQK